MTAAKEKVKGNVVQLKATVSDSDKETDKKWGKAVMTHGYCIIPSILLRAQQRLGLNPTQLAVLLQLCDYWWEKDRKPYPSKEAIGERLGLGPRQVQRYMAELETAGLLSRNERYAKHGGRLTNAYDLSGLVEKLKKIAPDFEEAKEIRRKAGRRGGIQGAAVAKKKQ